MFFKDQRVIHFYFKFNNSLHCICDVGLNTIHGKNLEKKNKSRLTKQYLKLDIELESIKFIF